MAGWWVAGGGQRGAQSAIARAPYARKGKSRRRAPSAPRGCRRPQSTGSPPGWRSPRSARPQSRV
eukprot:6065572-Prymnesium_polylepis.1